MEAIFFAADIVGIIWLLYWAIINDDRKPGTDTTGFFAYRNTVRRYRPAAATPPATGVGRSPASRPTRLTAKSHRLPEQPTGQSR